MTGIVFVEYRIREEARDRYLRFMREQLERYNRRPDGENAADPQTAASEAGAPETGTPALKWYEGSDQPGLFVEMWSDVPWETYLRMKRERTEDPHSPWREMDEMVEGGKAKIHIWHFKKAR